MLKIHYLKNGKMKRDLSIFIAKRKSVVFVFVNKGKRNNVEKRKRSAKCAPFYVANNL